VAVNDIDLTMASGEIFALLGHNGAGKTTTIQIITGMLEPSSGVVQAFGIDLFQDRDQLKGMLGVCPQHDILFESLTVEEHLRLFATLK